MCILDRLQHRNGDSIPRGFDVHRRESLAIEAGPLRNGCNINGSSGEERELCSAVHSKYGPGRLPNYPGLQ